jgi:hypothetical protein
LFDRPKPTAGCSASGRRIFGAPCTVYYPDQPMRNVISEDLTPNSHIPQNLKPHTRIVVLCSWIQLPSP